MIVKVKPKKLPQNLKSFRQAAGLSQGAAAKKIGFSSAATVAHYESGKRKIPIDLLSEIAQAYGGEVEIVFRFTK